MRPLFAVARVLLLLTAVVLAVTDHARAAPPDEAGYREIATRLVTGFAAPASKTFLDQAKRLNTETKSACATAGPAPEALRHAFRDLAGTWGRLWLARFGPLTDDSRYDKIAFWPDPRGVIRRQTAQLLSQIPTDGDAVTWIANQSAAVQGLPAFDLVAFGEDAGADWKSHCRMAAAIAGNVERMAAAIAAGFAEPGDLAVLTPKDDNPLFRTWQDAVATLFTVYTTQIEVLRATMISDVVRQAMISGAKAAAGAPPAAGGDARPTRVFLRDAPATKAFLIGAVDGLGEFLAAMQLGPYIEDDPRGLSERAGRDLQAVRTQIDGLPDDLAATLVDPAMWNRLSGAARSLEGFGRVVGVGYMSALGLKAGFNALDGD